MVKPLVVLALVLCFVSPASAGRNANGAILVHTLDSVVYSSGSLCDQDISAQTCQDLIANGSRTDRQAVWLVAAFPAGSTPSVAAIQFGIVHTFGDAIIGFDQCGPGISLQIPDADWPQGTGGSPTGVAIANSEPIESGFFAFYWFALDTSEANPESASFATTFYPRTHDAEFADDESPPQADRCYNFGVMRWNGTGADQCPEILPIGPCCLADDSCIETTEFDCITRSGAYQGDGAACAPETCIPATGACCFPDGTCHLLTEDQCRGYTCSVFQGPLTDCAVNACTPLISACCLPGGVCEMRTEVDCAAGTGSYLCGFTCDTEPCRFPPGACCFADQRCEILVLNECTEQGGIFHGESRTCEPTNPCAPPEYTGACCLEGGYCQYLSDYLCRVRGGDWRGEGTTCPPNPPCSSEPLLGACCFLESRCEQLTYSDCRSQSGWWRGVGIPCPPDPPCPWDAPTGACCLDMNGHCQVLTEAECDAHGGQYWGDDTPCGDPPCYNTPTKRTTWGGIRLRYR